MTTHRVLTLLGTLALAATATAADPVQPLSGEEIAVIWKERQEKVKTASFEFTRTHFVPKGGFTKANPYLIYLWDKEHPGSGKNPIPAQDTRLTSPCRLLVDGVKIRHDYFSKQVNYDKQEFYLRREQTAFDGTHFRIINGKTPEEEEGVVRQAGYYPEANHVAISVLLTSIRSRTNGLTMFNDIRTITATGRRTAIDGVECLEFLVGKQPDGSHNRHVWLAPAWGWQVVRDIGHAPKTDVMDKMDIRYKPDPTVGWLPSTWEFARVTRGELIQQSSFAVNSYTLNDPIPAGEFVLTFPNGQTVMDEDAKGGAVSGTVRETGLLVPDDGRPAYYLPGTVEPLWRKLIRNGLYALIAVTGCALGWRLRQRLRRSTLPTSTLPKPDGQGGRP